MTLRTRPSLPFTQASSEFCSRKRQRHDRENCTHEKRCQKYLSNPNQPIHEQPYKDDKIRKDADSWKKPSLPATGNYKMPEAC